MFQYANHEKAFDTKFDTEMRNNIQDNHPYQLDIQRREAWPRPFGFSRLTMLFQRE